MKGDGGPAHPVTITDKSGQIAPTYPGMSLRDYFAGQALVGILASRSNVYETVFNAEMAYCNADAMLAERGEV